MGVAVDTRISKLFEDDDFPNENYNIHNENYNTPKIIKYIFCITHLIELNILGILISNIIILITICILIWLMIYNYILIIFVIFYSITTILILFIFYNCILYKIYLKFKKFNDFCIYYNCIAILLSISILFLLISILFLLIGETIIFFISFFIVINLLILSTSMFIYTDLDFTFYRKFYEDL